MYTIIIFGNSYIIKSFIKLYQNKYNFIIIDRTLYDITCPNYERIIEIFNNNKPDICIDSICPILPVFQYSENNMKLLNYSLNHINFINSLIHKYHISQMIYFSSAGILYTNDSIEENYYNNISNLYGLLKIQSECLYKYYASLNCECQYKILRISNVYGHHEFHKTIDNGIINILLKNYKNNKETEITSSNVSKNYIYVDDLSNIIHLLINYIFNKNYEIINIGSPYNYTIDDIINIILKKFTINIKYNNNKIYNNNYFTININKLQQIIGDYKFVTLENYINTLFSNK